MNDSKQRTAAIKGLEDISALVRRYAEIERIYLQGSDITLGADLKAAVMKLYTHILEYEARAACQFNRNTAIQIARNIVEADSWGDILGKIKESETACDQLMRIIDAKDQRACMTKLDVALNEQNHQVNKRLIVSRTQDEELLAEGLCERTKKIQTRARRKWIALRVLEQLLMKILWKKIRITYQELVNGSCAIQNTANGWMNRHRTCSG